MSESLKIEPELGDVKAFRFFEGEITVIKPIENTCSVTTVDYGVIEDIPISYLCQSEPTDMQTETGDTGFYAFKLEDKVIIEWNSLISTTIPVKEDCRIIGFTDGLPRYCRYRIMVIQYKSYVAFYNCDKGCCYIPEQYDTDLLLNMWSGPEWIYFETLSTNPITFIESAVGTVTEAINPGVLTVDPVLGALTATLKFAPALYESPRYYAGTSYAPAVTSSTYRRCDFTVTAADSVRICHSAGELDTMRMTITSQGGTFLHNGVDLLPEDWVYAFDLVDITSVQDPTHHMRSNHHKANAGNDWYNFCMCGYNTGPLAEFDVPRVSQIPTGIFHAYGEYHCSHSGPTDTAPRDIFSTSGGSRYWFISKDFNTDWRDKIAPYMGEGEHAITLPTGPRWDYLPEFALIPEEMDTTTFPKCINAKLIAHTEASYGYVEGQKEGCDWNWGFEEGYTFGMTGGGSGLVDDYYWNTQIESHLSDQTVPTLHTPPDVYEWDASEHTTTLVLTEGKGYITNRKAYFNLATELTDPREYSLDSAERTVRFLNYIYEPSHCIGCNCSAFGEGCDGGGLSDVLDITESIDKKSQSGSKLYLEGRTGEDRLIVAEVWDNFEQSWWTGFQILPDPISATVTLYAAVKNEDISEWAKNTIHGDSASWISEFYQRMMEASTENSVGMFITSCTGGELKYQYPELEEP